MKRGDVSGCSFSFRTLKDEWTYSADGGTTLRTLIDVELFDVGPVTFPAYPATDVAVRSMEDVAAEGKRRLAEQAPKSVPVEVRRRELELAEAE
jgi:phage head maturation protease